MLKKMTLGNVIIFVLSIICLILGALLVVGIMESRDIHLLRDKQKPNIVAYSGDTG